MCPERASRVTTSRPSLPLPPNWSPQRYGEFVGAALVAAPLDRRLVGSADAVGPEHDVSRVEAAEPPLPGT